MIPRICYSPSVKRNTATPVSFDDFRQMAQSPYVQEICDRIILLDGKDATELARLKQQLPVVFFHAQRFANNRRHSADAVPSGLVMLDIDHVENPKDFADKWVVTGDDAPNNVLKKQRIALIAKTPSNHGLRIVGEMREGETVTGAQQRLAAFFDIDQFDAVTKDLARASFVMPWAYIYYADPELLEFPDQATADKWAEPTPSLPTGEGEEKLPSSVETNITPSLCREGRGGSWSPSELDHTRKVAAQLLELLGGTPTLGERNNIYYNLCRHMRTICAFDPMWLIRALPDFELPLAERLATANSAVASTRTADKTPLLRQAIDMVERSEQEESLDEEDIHSTSVEGARGALSLPPLPKVLEKICSRVPEPYRPALVIACLPVLGTLATRVRFTYLDHQEQSFSFMSCVIAPPAAGKSFIRKPTQLLLTPIDAQDEIERQKEQEYKDALRASKNSKQQPENPRPCPRNNGVNISVAKLLQLLSYSDGKHLIGIAEELDTLAKSEKAGVWSQKRDIYRLAFDNAFYGQNYMSDNSFSANVPVFYNLLLTGTPNAAARFFRDVEDGLITRFCFAQLPDMFGKDIPDFQDYTEAERKYIIGTATNLMQADATLSCPGVNKHIAKWVREKGEEAVREDSRAKDTLRKRAAVIGFRAGYLAYLLNGCKYAKEVGLFAVWVAQYTFENQMALFGDKFEEVMQEQMEANAKKTANTALFDALPATFSYSELCAARQQRKLSINRSTVTMLISRWTKKELIEQVERNKYKKR